MASIWAMTMMIWEWKRAFLPLDHTCTATLPGFLDEKGKTVQAKARLRKAFSYVWKSSSCVEYVQCHTVLNIWINVAQWRPAMFGEEYQVLLMFGWSESIWTPTHLLPIWTTLHSCLEIFQIWSFFNIKVLPRWWNRALATLAPPRSFSLWRNLNINQD